MTEYKDFLRSYIAQARAKGATPMLVTSHEPAALRRGGQDSSRRWGIIRQWMREIAKDAGGGG